MGLDSKSTTKGQEICQNSDATKFHSMFNLGISQFSKVLTYLCLLVMSPAKRESSKGVRSLTSILPLKAMVSCLHFLIGIALTSRLSDNRGPTKKKLKLKTSSKHQRSDGQKQSAFWHWQGSLDDKAEKPFRNGHVNKCFHLPV